MLGTFAHDVKIVQVITSAAGAAGTSAISGTAVAMEGYGGCCFVVQFGPIVGGAVTSFKVQQDTVVGMTSAADILGSNQAVADTADNTVFYCDIRAPQKDFLQLLVSRGTQAATCTALAFLYRGSSRPVSHGSGVSGEVFVGPAEGTA